MDLWAKADGLTAREIIDSAAKADVVRMLCVGCDLEDSKLSIDFVQRHPECFASIGIHPHEAQHYFGRQELLDEFAALVKSPRVIAIGECGFDFYYNHSPRAAQTEVLEFQLGLAKTHTLPCVFHVREAFDDFWRVYDKYHVPGVLHSFTDSGENLARAVERGLYIGVNGIATFAKAQQLEVYKTIPLEYLLLETDAPFLTPHPYRGTVNQPKNIRVIAEFMAELRGERLEDLAAKTTANARTLFGI